jgi:glutathione S-transferase
MREREYIGAGYSLGDITYIPFFVRLQRYQANIDDSLPNLNAWMRRLLDRPVVRATP